MAKDLFLSCRSYLKSIWQANANWSTRRFKGGMLGWHFISTYHFLGMVESSFRTDKKNYKKTYRRNSVITLIMADVKKKKKKKKTHVEITSSLIRFNFQLSLEFLWQYRPRHCCVSWPFPTNQGKIHPFPTHKLDWWGNYASRVVRLSRWSSILNCW